MAACRSPIFTGGRAALLRLAASAPSRKMVDFIRKPIGLNLKVRALYQEAKVDAMPSGKDGNSIDRWNIKMLYDGDCPLCMREVDFLKKRNEMYKAIKFVDISSSDYSPMDNEGLDYKTVMGRIHVILSDGTVVRDVEAFRRLYEEVGLGWVYAITKYEPVATIVAALYSVWAKYRLPLTGRPPIDEIIKLRKNSGEFCEDGKTCKM